MDVQRYISSGIIESHVAGLATDQEVRELLAAMAQYPEVKAAVEAAQLDMERYITMQSVPPPADLKDKIFTVITDDGTSETSASAASSNTSDDHRYSAYDEEPERVVSVSRKWQYIAAAAIIGLVISVGANVMYYNSTLEWKGKYQTLLTDNQSLTAQNEAFQAKLTETSDMVAMMNDPDVTKVKLPTTRKELPQSQVTVFWNTTSQEVFLSVNNLPEPAADQQYQLWAIVNGKPVDAGVFEMGDHAKALQKMKSITGAKMFAVTLEKKGGSPSPTLTAMQVAGKVSS